MNNGNKRSRHNAVKHGILSDFFLADDHMGEESETYRRLLATLRKSVRPVDSLDEFQIEKLAFLYFRLIRVYKADWRLAPKLFDKLEKSIDAEHPYVIQGLFDSIGDVIGRRADPTPELLLRYEANIERTISRTWDQLQRWRTMRPISSEPPTKPGSELTEGNPDTVG